MKGTRHSEEQIIAILKQGEAGVATTELCRQHGISEQTYYRWKAKYGGMDRSEAKPQRKNRRQKVAEDLNMSSADLDELGDLTNTSGC
jgi:putative transposase